MLTSIPRAARPAPGLLPDKVTRIGEISPGGPPATEESAKIKASAPAQTWAACANENQTCSFPSPQELRTVRYGANEQYAYKTVSGVSAVPCSNAAFGDPIKGVTKKCAYLNGSILALDPQGPWAQIASEGQVFGVWTASKPMWIRYGSSTTNRWVYAVVDYGTSGGGSCSNSYFGMDPSPGGKKACFQGPYASDAQQGFADCAAENQTCTPLAGEAVLLRYGVPDSFIYRVVRSPTIACTNSTFGYDPKKGAPKYCAYTQFPVAPAPTAGFWTYVSRCHGRDCPLNETIVYGTQKTDAWATTDEWATEVTVSASVEMTVGKGKGAISTSVSASYAHSQSYSAALSSSLTRSLQVTCRGSSSTVDLQLWRFQTQTDLNCYYSGTCTGMTYTADYVCASNPPPGWEGPQCLPGYCANELCTECAYPTEAPDTGKASSGPQHRSQSGVARLGQRVEQDLVRAATSFTPAVR